MPERPLDLPPVHVRRRRYPGKSPREFHDKYKELNPERYPGDVAKVLAAGKTPAGAHLPIMVDEVLRCLRPRPGEVAVDCTLGGGGHARAILDRVRPGGRVIGLDIDPLELPRTEVRLRASGFEPDVFVARHANFAGLPKVLAAEGLTRVDLILADLGVSSMQFDNPDRGFSYKGVGPLDMRMNPLRGESAAQLIARSSEEDLARLLEENADEPHAHLVARLLKQQPLDTTHALERLLRAGLNSTLPGLAKADVKMSTRRTFQALRIAVNDEFAALDALLRVLPQCLAPGGRVAILTFHSGEDRRVKKAFQAGHREGCFPPWRIRSFAPPRRKRSRTGAPPRRNSAGPCGRLTDEPPARAGQLTLLEQVKRLRTFVLSPTSVGMAVMIPLLVAAGLMARP